MTDDPMRLLAAALVLLGWLALCAVIVARERWRRRRAAREAAGMVPAEDGREPVLVAFASQTGFAEQLAWQTARLLRGAGVPVQLSALGQLGLEQLGGYRRALFVVSTYGEGDPPDNASAFARRVMSDSGALSQLSYAVLALGDRAYANFCGFGRSLDQWLSRQGAQPLFERVDVDNAAEKGLKYWQSQLARLAGIEAVEDAGPADGWGAAPFESWRLAERRLLNPGSSGEPLYHIELTPPGSADASPDGGVASPSWQAGDLVQMRVPADPEHPRDYSIASLPADGRLHLLVRAQLRTDGTPGLASALLCHGLAEGDSVELRLRPNRGFRLDGNEQRPLILVGNGSGFAGLRALLKARAAAGGKPPCWLVFGERQQAHDDLYRDEVQAWLDSGLLARADRVFSRDQPQRLYVQDRIEQSADALRAWVADGAAIYVCGSLEGMAGGVDAALRRVLGDGAVEQLRDEGRYRRDVY